LGIINLDGSSSHAAKDASSGSDEHSTESSTSKQQSRDIVQQEGRGTTHSVGSASVPEPIAVELTPLWDPHFVHYHLSAVIANGTERETVQKAMKSAFDTIMDAVDPSMCPQGFPRFNRQGTYPSMWIGGSQCLCNEGFMMVKSTSKCTSHKEIIANETKQANEEAQRHSLAVLIQNAKKTGDDAEEIRSYYQAVIKCYSKCICSFQAYQNEDYLNPLASATFSAVSPAGKKYFSQYDSNNIASFKLSGQCREVIPWDDDGQCGPNNKDENEYSYTVSNPRLLGDLKDDICGATLTSKCDAPDPDQQEQQDQLFEVCPEMKRYQSLEATSSLADEFANKVKNDFKSLVTEAETHVDLTHNLVCEWISAEPSDKDSTHEVSKGTTIDECARNVQNKYGCKALGASFQHISGTTGNCFAVVGIDFTVNSLVESQNFQVCEIRRTETDRKECPVIEASDTSRASTAIGTGGDDREHDAGTTNVPNWAFWLIGAVGALTMAMNAVLLYVNATLRSKDQPNVAVQLDAALSTYAPQQAPSESSTENPRGRATSMQAIDVINTEVSSLTPKCTAVTSRGVTPTGTSEPTTQQGIICLD